MKLSTYAKQVGVTYTTAWRWWRDGKISGYQTETGTVVITEPVPESLAPEQGNRVAIYARVSSKEQEDDLKRQLNRLRDFAAALGLKINLEVSEIGSSLDEERSKLNRLLADLSVGTILVEHPDTLSRFGFNYIETLLKAGNRQLIVLNESEVEDELMDDFKSVITAMCIRLYGRRTGKHKAKKMIECLE